MRIYLAGPMRGIPYFNFPAFDAAADAAWTARDLDGNLRVMQRADVFNPAQRDRDAHGDNVNDSPTGDVADVEATGFTLRDALGADTAWICQHADAIVVLPGWENSKGARAEVALGRALGLKIVTLASFCDGTDHDPEAATIERQEKAAADLAEFGATLAANMAKQPFDEHVDEALLVVSTSPIDDAALIVEAQIEAAWRTGGVPCREVHGATAEEFIPAEVRTDSRSGLLVETSASGEVRVTSATGGEKGSKPARFDLIPTDALFTLATLYGKGAEKYEARNWERGYDWSLSFAALMRHLWAFWGGEDIDAIEDGGTGLPHLASAGFHVFALLTFLKTHPEYDDRPVTR